MAIEQITPEKVREWLEHIADYGVVPQQMKTHVVFIAIEYLKLAESEPRLLDPLDYMLRPRLTGWGHD